MAYEWAFNWDSMDIYSEFNGHLIRIQWELDGILIIYHAKQVGLPAGVSKRVCNIPKSQCRLIAGKV